MKRTILIAGAVLALVLGLVAYAGAAPSDTLSVTATIPSVMSLTLDDTTVDFAIVDPDVATAGDGAVTVGVKSNVVYDLTYAAADFVGPAAAVMPVSVMDFKVGAGAFGAFGNTGTLEDAHARGVDNYVHTYRITPGLTYEAGDYSTSVVYTVAAN